MIVDLAGEYSTFTSISTTRGWGCYLFIVLLDWGLNVALTHQNRSYRDQGKRRDTEKEAERGQRQEEDIDN